MKRHLTYRLSLAAVAAMSVSFFSCKDDEDPVKPVITFQQAARTVGEDAGTIDVLLQLDVDAPQDLKVRYSLSGTASEGTSSSADYQVLGSFGEVSVAKGASSGTIQLQIRNDDAVEPDETIIITLTEVVNNAATIGSTNVTTITVTSDDQGSAVSFATAARTVVESDGLIDIDLTLDKVASQALTVNYSFNYNFEQRTAIDAVWAAEEGIPSQYYDFAVEGGTYGTVTIPAGSTTGKITLRLYSDFMLEDPEMIEITLTGVSAGGQLGTAVKHTITVEQEDGRLVGLLWDETYTDVDMDMFLWWGEDENSFEANPLAMSANADTENTYEIIFIPKVLIDEVVDATFGLSLVYYSGTADPLEFKTRFLDFENGDFVGTAQDFDGSYTLANINEWDQASGTDPQIEQTFVLAGGEFTTISPITTPASGSRRATYQIPPGTTRNKAGISSQKSLRWMK